MTTATHDEAAIREAAFYIWLEEGRPEGRDLAHWDAARARLGEVPQAKARRKPAAKPKAKTAAAKTAAATASAPAKTAKAPAKRRARTATKA